jgi:hypothetical protein
LASSSSWLTPGDDASARFLLEGLVLLPNDPPKLDPSYSETIPTSNPPL